MKKKRILALAPHTDDAELGAGGYIYQSILQGATVLYVAFSDCKNSLDKKYPPNTLSKECLLSTKTLGISYTKILDFDVRNFHSKRQEILDKLIEIKKDFNPEEVLTPSRSDIHQDHQVITNEAIRAYKMCSILGYELPWNCFNIHLDYFVELTEETIKKKLEALKKYESQKQRFYFSKKYILNHLKSKGSLIEVDFAETFEIIRKVDRLR